MGAKVAPKWLQNSIKKLIDFWIALGRALGRQSGSTPAKICPPRLHGEVGKGLKPLPRGKRGSGKKDSWKEGASKPPVAQRLVGLSEAREQGKQARKAN